jgi:hypothetical protein
VTDTSSQGSLTQLTDVLYLLTDSQELLLQRVQAMRTEITRSVPTVTERTPSTLNASTSSIAVSRTPLVTVSPLNGITSSKPTNPEPKTVEAKTPEAKTPINPPSDVVDSSPSTTQSSSIRSYNFFDDLDALLADLEGPDAAP